MLDILVFPKEALDKEAAWNKGECFSFTNDGFELLIATGVFSIGHVKSPSGYSAIDVGKHKQRIIDAVNAYPTWQARKKFIDALDRFDYVTGSL